jgi:hypothetical protein
MLAIAGNPVSIDCTEIQAEVLADMIFGLPNGTTLAPGERLGKFVVQRHGPRNIVLIIDNVDSRDQGIYRCVAQISVDGVINGMDSSYSPLYVYAPPVITYQHSITVTENHNVELACNVNGSPPPDVKWYVGHKEILTGGRFVIQINYSLLISNVQKSDEREYLCEAVNLLGQAQSFLSLRVKVLKQQSWKLHAKPCSHSCGLSGRRIIEAQCINRSGMRVADSLCTDQKPAARQMKCNRISCPE